MNATAKAEISETQDGWEWSVEADGEEWASGVTGSQYEAAREAAQRVFIHFAWDLPTLPTDLANQTKGES